MRFAVSCAKLPDGSCWMWRRRGVRRAAQLEVDSFVCLDKVWSQEAIAREAVVIAAAARKLI